MKDRSQESEVRSQGSGFRGQNSEYGIFAQRRRGAEKMQDLTTDGTDFTDEEEKSDDRCQGSGVRIQNIHRKEHKER